MFEIKKPTIIFFIVTMIDVWMVPLWIRLFNSLNKFLFSETTIVVMGGQGNGSPGRLKTVEEIDIDGNSNPLPNLNIER